MSKLTLTLLMLFATCLAFSQISYTANDVVTPYDGHFRPAVNLGNYTSFTTQNLANLAGGNPDIGIKGVGAKALRPGMFEEYTALAGYDAQIDNYQYFEYLGMSEHNLIVGFPSDAVRDPNFYCSNHQSELFANLYEPIWDDGSDGTPINEDNYYAAYLYNVVIRYKDYVRLWEIWNEPGFDYTGGVGWAPPGTPNNWWDNNPDPCDYKLRAPIFHYIRILRISWEIIKSYDPDGYVVLSGIGYPSFLDAILRNTDNPDGGSVSGDFPFAGGAYFDMVGYHSYPHFDGSVRKWNEDTQDWDYFRHSDAAAQGMLATRDSFNVVLQDYGYGSIFPEKEWMISEINLPRKAFGDFMGSKEAQRNFLPKAVVNCMKNNIRQMQVYRLSEDADFDNAYDEFDLMGLYQRFDYNNFYFQTPNDEGVAYKTVSDILYKKTYDPNRTNALNLPDHIDGGAFVDDSGNYTYCLWAKTQTDLSENATATYSFPTNLGIDNLIKRDWTYGYDPQSSNVDPNDIQLTASPIYLTERIFDVNETGGCAPFSLQFQADDYGAEAEYQWLFEGGTPVTSTLPNPELTLFLEGEYFATLTVFDANGEFLAQQTERIVVETAPTVDFSVVQSGPIAFFENNSSFNADEFLWNFGDGNTSTEPNPDHLYLEDGTYEVTLLATNNCGSVEMKQTLEVDVPSTTQITETANDSVPTFDGTFRPSTNREFYAGWTDEQMADIVAGNPAEEVDGIGIKSLRASIGEAFFKGWGYDFKVPLYDHYSNLDLNGNSFILDFPSPESRDTIFYCPDHQSNLFRDIYLDIWDDGADGTPINDDNLYAAYVYQTVINYGPYVDFWEVLSSPDFDFTGDYAWLPPGQPGNWWENNPDPCDYSLRAPVFYYVRQLRIAYEIIKNYDPDSYVTISGISYPSFLDAICRNTDNPLDGSAVLGYEKTGGAYFDAVGFKSYPHFDGSTIFYDVTQGQFVYERHSDAAVAGISRIKNEFQAVLDNYGYDGQTYPPKEWIISEANVPRKQLDQFLGGDEVQINWIIKAWLECVKNDIRRLNIHRMAEAVDYADAQNTFDIIGLFQKIEGTTPYNQTPNNQAIALKTTSELLFGTTYDAARTNELALPNNVDGAVFIDGNGAEIYVLWAKTSFDESEGAFATYAFPTSFGLSDLYQKNWYFSFSGDTEIIDANAVALSGTPIFLSATEVTETPPVAYFEKDQDVVCMQETVSFSDLSQFQPTNWEWHFPGGTPATSTEQNPEIIYNTPGIYEVQLTASNATGAHTYTAVDYVEVLGSPVAAFEINVNGNTAIIDNQTQFAEGYIWTYGDGSVDGSFSPVHTYFSNGTYEITMVAFNDCGTDTLSQEVTISAAPQTNFTKQFLGNCDELLYTFIDASQASPTSWNWTFEGATPAVSNSQFPTVTFFEPGIFEVTLEASNDFGTNTFTQMVYIEGNTAQDVEIEICAGDTFNGLTINQDTTIIANLQTQNLGCDSIINYYVAVVETLSSSMQIDLCQGDTFQGATWDSDTLLIEHFTSQNGCDSVVFIDLTIYETFETSVFDTIDIGMTYTIGGNEFDETGIYEINLQTNQGCDSTIVLNLFVTDDVAVWNRAEELMDLQVFPNPFGDQMTIQYDLVSATKIQGILLDVTGKVVARPVHPGAYQTGSHQITLDTEFLPAGLYYLRFEVGDAVIYRKVVKV